MTEYVVRAVINADAKGLVQGVQQAETAVEGLKAEYQRVGRIIEATDRNIQQSAAGPGVAAVAAATRNVSADADRTAAATARMGSALGGVANTAALTRQQMMALNYTVNDVVASLASGISPMTILMQQGPQLSDAWGGVGPLFASISTVLTPMRLIIGGVAAATVAAIAAGLSYADSIRQLDVAVRAHGNTLGLTADAYRGLAAEMASAANVSERAGRDIAAGFVRAGVQSDAAMRMASEAARGFAVATGTDAVEAAAELARALAQPGRGARELAEEFNLLDDATVQQIISMERQGDIMGAQERLAQAVQERFASLKGEVGLLELAFDRMGIAASNAWDWIGKIGNSPVASQMLAGLLPGQTGLQFFNTSSPAASGPEPSIDQEMAAQGGAYSRATNAAETRALGDLNRRYDTATNRLRELADAETRVRRAIASGIGDQAVNERTLNGILEERKRLLDGQRTEADKLAEKTTQRLTDLRAEVALAERLAAVRAGGDRRAVREAEAEARAIQGGFDPATAQGREAAGLFARAGAVADHARAAEDLRRQMTALQGPLATAIADAHRWRDETLGGLDAAAAGYQDYVAMVEAVHGERIAKALAEDLRRRTDWAAGIQRGLADLKAAAADFAATAEAAVKGWSSEGQNAFVAFARTGRLEVGGLADFVVEQFAKIAYQRTLQGPLDTLGGFIFDGFTSLLNGILGGGGAASPGPRIGPPVLHTGGILGTDAVPLRSLPRFHSGVLANDETLAVIRSDEGVFTPRQMDNANALIAAIATRPIMIELPGAASPGGMPRVEVHVHGGPGAPQRTEQRRTDDGGLRLDLIYDDMAGRMADDVSRGRGPLGAALESTYGITRTPVRR